MHRSRTLGASEEGPGVLGLQNRTGLLAGAVHSRGLALRGSKVLVELVLGHGMTADADSTVALGGAGTKFGVSLKDLFKRESHGGERVIGHRQSPC